MLSNVTTPYVAIWDTDVIALPDDIQVCLNELRKENAKIALPYNGICMDTSYIIRNIFMRTLDINVLIDNSRKMRLLKNHALVGGAVLINRIDFVLLGGENEGYFGWGDDDFDRFIKFKKKKLATYRSKNILFHLSHPRLINSSFNGVFKERISKNTLFKTTYCT